MSYSEKTRSWPWTLDLNYATTIKELGNPTSLRGNTAVWIGTTEATNGNIKIGSKERLTGRAGNRNMTSSPTSQRFPSQEGRPSGTANRAVLMTEQVSLPLSDDALRMRGEPGNLEWWYFDATLDDGGTIVLVYYVDVATSGEMFYTATIMVARPGKPVVYKEYKTPDGSASRERPEYRAGKSTVSGDLMTYRLVIDAAELGGIGCDLTLRRTVPARVSKSNGTLIHDGDHEFGWVCAVPRGTVGGTIILDGETSTITGDAYHDHNWVSTTMGSMLHHWHWGRAAIGPYTAVIMTVYPLKAFAGTHAGGLQSIFVASPDDVMVNVEGYDAALVDATPGTNPDPRNPQAYYAPEIRYEVDREGRRVAVQFHNAAFISSAELATETKFVTDDERERAKSLPVKPWYSRFVASPVSLTITENGKEHTFTGEGVTDFMDFHLSD